MAIINSKVAYVTAFGGSRVLTLLALLVPTELPPLLTARSAAEIVNPVDCNDGSAVSHVLERQTEGMPM